MSELKNDFSWSHSRADCFRRCPRQYFFNYYGSWGGWERNAASRTRAFYVLKQLRNRQMWAGEKVHTCIRQQLELIRHGYEPLAVDVVIEKMLREMREEWRDSGEGLYWDEPKKRCALWEHELEIDLPDEEWKKTVDHALECIRVFHASEIFRKICALSGSQWLELENLGRFQIDDFTVFAQLDFALRDDTGIIIYDWKTGRADKETTRDQLAVYILYAAQKWSAPATEITAREFNLAQNTIHETRLTEIEIADAREKILSSAETLAALHGKPESEFPFVEDESACRSCNFVKACPKWINDG